MEEFKAAKILRTAIRLKHSINADEEINELVPDTIATMREALTRGEQLQLSGVLEGIIDGVSTKE